MDNKVIMLNTFYEANEFIELIESREYNSSKLVSKVPLAINCIFACELYLKIMLMQNNLKISELKKEKHNLKKLFLKLPKSKQTSIENWMNWFHQKDVFQLLDEIKHDFTHLRYMYLENNIKNFDLNMMVQFMYKMQHEVSISLLGYDIKIGPNTQAKRNACNEK